MNQQNKLIENIRNRVAHNKPILKHISRIAETPQYEQLLKTIFENIIIDESQQINVKEELKRDLRKPSFLSIKNYTPYMHMKIIRLSTDDMKTENMMSRNFGHYNALIELIEKDSASALKGHQWKKIISATKYILKNDTVKFVFIEFIGGTDRMFRGAFNLSEIISFLQVNRNKVLIKDFLENLKDALNNAYSLGKAHVSGKLKAKIGSVAQSGNVHNKESVIKEHKGGLTAIKTHAKALLVPDEYLIIQHDINLNALLVNHTLNNQLIEFLKSKVTPEDELRKEIKEKDDIIKRLLDKIDKLEK